MALVWRSPHASRTPKEGYEMVTDVQAPIAVSSAAGDRAEEGAYTGRLACVARTGLLAIAALAILAVAAAAGASVQTPAGVAVTTVAGSGNEGFTDGPAAIAQFYRPHSV